MRIGALLLVVAIAAACGGGGGAGDGGILAASCSCPGGTCDASGVCVLPRPDGGVPLTCPAADKPLGASTADASQVQHLGTVPVGREVGFAVPPGTVSVTIIEQAVSAPDFITLDGAQLDNTAVPLFVKDPSGTLVYDDRNVPSDPVAIAELPAFFASDSPATGTLTIPNSTGGLSLLGSSGSLPAGSWLVTVSDFANECASGQGVPAGSTCTGGSTASSYDVTVVTKPSGAGGIPTTGALDVAFYFATTTAPLPSGQNVPLSAATAGAGGDPDLNRMVQTLGQLFSSAGIALRHVTFTDLPAPVQATYATGVNVDETGACGPLSQLLKLSAPGNTLNIFFVSSFQATGLQSSNQVVGIDGTIPGPSTVGGTVASGAAVATHDLRAGRSACAGGFQIGCGADVTAYIVAHEAGHFLGLYHVTESDGTAFDPLLDTPACACQSCAPASLRTSCADSSPAPAAGTEHQMSVADCTASATCGGGDNLMFWILDQGSRGLLSPEQMQIVRANPLVQ